MTRDGRVRTSQKTADTVRAAKRSAAQCDETADAPESKRLRSESCPASGPCCLHRQPTEETARLPDCQQASEAPEPSNSAAPTPAAAKTPAAARDPFRDDTVLFLMQSALTHLQCCQQERSLA